MIVYFAILETEEWFGLFAHGPIDVPGAVTE